MRSYRSHLSCIIVAGLCSGGVLMAQGTQTASVTGEIVEKNGTPVAGVTVRLTSPALQGQRTLVTTEKGRFITRLLPPGFYTFDIYKSGYQTIKITQQLGMDQNFQPRLVMSQIQNSVVEVVAAPPAVDKSDVKTATNFQLDAVDKLPTLNRNIETVAELTPGVTRGVGDRIQIRGAMTGTNAYLVDGQNVEDNAYGTRGVSVINDAVEEIQIITGAISAEYGNVEGGVMNTLTRSGSNDFSGQVRMELSRDSWNAVKPLQDRSVISDVLNKDTTYSVSGPIVKDRLWFYLARYEKNSNQSEALEGDTLGAAAGNASYTYSFTDKRWQGKLTWAITDSHTLVGSYNKTDLDEMNRDYSAGELAALVPQVTQRSFWNVALRSLWTPTFTTDLRYGRKKQMLSAGGDPAGGSPLYNYNDEYFYHNGIFNSSDGGDNRLNETANAKGSLFWEGMGSHQTEFGVDYYKGTRRARNEQSPTNMIFGVTNLDLATQTAEGADIWIYQSTPGKAVNDKYGFFVNDKWSVNAHWSIQIGARVDTFKAKNESGTKTASASGFSPRLGVKYDLYGDSKWIFGASYARYNGKVMEGVTNAVTGQGNPIEVDYAYIGPAGAQPYSVIFNAANYDLTTAGIGYYNNPSVNVRLADKLKAPYVDEFQGSAAYSYTEPTFGKGFVRVTGVYKKWGDIIDYRIGTEGLSDPVVTGARYYLKVWGNNPDAIRVYKGLEFDFQWQKDAFSATGNVTISSLRGNFEGEGSSSPSRGEGINAWNVSNLYDSSYNLTASNQTLWDKGWTTPYGYLSGHIPVSSRLTFNYTKDFGIGPTTLGVIYRYTAGKRYSDTRSIHRKALNASTPSQAGTYLTQYMDMERGGGSFNGLQFFDLSVSQDFNTPKVLGKPVTVFGKLVVRNLFNKIQQESWNTVWDPVGSTGSVNSAWVPSAGHGTATSADNYGDARTIVASVGVRY